MSKERDVIVCYLSPIRETLIAKAHLTSPHHTTTHHITRYSHFGISPVGSFWWDSLIQEQGLQTTTKPFFMSNKVETKDHICRHMSNDSCSVPVHSSIHYHVPRIGASSRSCRTNETSTSTSTVHCIRDVVPPQSLAEEQSHKIHGGDHKITLLP